MSTSFQAPQPLRIGILGLQGAFIEHQHALYNLDPSIQVHIIRTPGFSNLDGIILPGGESTVMSLMAKRLGIWKELGKWVKDGKPIMGTCAGLIMLARDVIGRVEGQASLMGLDCQVHRNFYGEQYDSFVGTIKVAKGCPGLEELAIPGVFIRAPLILSAAPEVQVLATIERKEQEQIVAIQQKKCLGLAFHPELADSVAWHRYFINNLVMPERTSHDG